MKVYLEFEVCPAVADRCNCFLIVCPECFSAVSLARPSPRVSQGSPEGRSKGPGCWLREWLPHSLHGAHGKLALVFRLANHDLEKRLKQFELVDYYLKTLLVFNVIAEGLD